MRVPPPTSREEIWGLLEEAASRYAKVTAFIMAEQGLSSEEMGGKHLRDYKDDLVWLDPVDVVDALRRRQVMRDNSPESLAERVVVALDSFGGDDVKEVVVNGARNYRAFLRSNEQELTGDGFSATGHVLDDAIGSITGENDSSVFLPRLNIVDFRTYGGPAENARLLVSMKHIEGWRSKFPGSSTRPFMEDTRNGLRVNLTDERYIRFTVDYFRQKDGAIVWNVGRVLRCVDDGDGELVLGSVEAPDAFSLMVEMLTV